MIYVFDTNSLSNILNHYYRDRFPTFWEKLDEMIDRRRLVSVREARFELELRFNEAVIEQLERQNPDFFEDPTPGELAFITDIYSVPHFRHNLDRKKLLQGGYFAGPFIIAKAKATPGYVVTEEDKPDHGARIPNICEHFKIECGRFQDFLNLEDWKF